MSAPELSRGQDLRRLKSSQILLLLALGEHRTLRKAAAALNTTQPAATRLLRSLEEALGYPLFERHRRGLRPTGFGEIMLRHARTVAAEFDRTRHELAALAAGGAGRVRVGAVPSAVPFFIARSIACLKRAEPRLDVSVAVATSDVLLGALARGELDVLVARRWETPDYSDFAYEGSIDEPLVVAARAGHPLCSARPPLALGDLIDWPWIMLPPGSPMRQVLAPLFHAAGVARPANLVETSSMIMIIALLQDTDALAVIPDDVLRSPAGRHLLRALPVDLPPVMGAYGILTRRDRPTSPGLEIFLQALREVILETRHLRETSRRERRPRRGGSSTG